MEVCEARPVVAQAEVMQDELDFSLRTDYTPESLPLLLHQVIPPDVAVFLLSEMKVWMSFPQVLFQVIVGNTGI